MRLAGETTGRPGSDETRVPINIDADVRERLRALLYEPYMRGVGWSEFIDRAVALARAEGEAASADKKLLVVRYDVTELDEAQRSELELSAVVQGERKKVSFPDEVGYPDVSVTTDIVDGDAVERRECCHGVALAVECEDCRGLLAESGRDYVAGGTELRYVEVPR